METIKFKAVIDSEYFNNPPYLKIHLDDDVLFDGAITEEMVLERTLQLEDDSGYKLNFTLHDKSKYDTVLEDGKIIKDTIIKIESIELDDVDITNILPVEQEKCYYTYGGQKHPFYDVIGVNGTSTIEFFTPFYVWLLETL